MFEANFSFSVPLDILDWTSVYMTKCILLAPKMLLEDLWPMITIHPTLSNPNPYIALKTKSHELR